MSAQSGPLASTASLFCLLAFALAASPVSAPAQAPPAPAPIADKYAAEPLIVERIATTYTYALDGTGTKQIVAVARMQSDAAARQYSVLNVPFAGANEHVEIAYVRVRKPDGTLVDTPPADAQEMPQEVTRLAPFYSDLKEKQVPVRSLRTGDKLEYSVKIVRTRAEAPGEFWGQENFGAGVIVLESTVELHVPKSKYVNVWSPEHKPTLTETAGEKIYQWKGSQLEPTIKASKDKASEAELDAKPDPPKKELNPEGEYAPIAWTTFKSWEAVGAWYRALETDRITPDADVKAKAAELTAGKSTDEEKVRALYAFVSTQVRYIGVALGVGRYQPHPAGEVLRNQYGDCKDKHTLLAALLTAQGFHPEAALIGAGIRLNPDVPSPGAFNHLITALPLDHKLIWLDATAEVAPYRVLVFPIRDKQALVVPDTGVAALERTPAALPFTPVDTFVSTGTLAKDGTITAVNKYTARGDNEIIFRTVFRQVPPGQWDELVQGISQRLGFAGTTSHPEVTRPELTTEPMQVSYEYKREKLGDWDNYRIVPLMPVVYITTVDEKDPPQSPIELGEPTVFLARSVITLPPGWGAELPDSVHQKAPFATYDKTYKIDHDTVTVERRLEVLQKRVPSADWKAYKKFLDDTINLNENYIQLTRTSADSTDKGPPAAGNNNTEAATLVHDAYEQVQRGEANAAQSTLDRAKKLNPRQARLWSTYGYLHFQRQDFAAATEDYKKELALDPNATGVYRDLAQAQMLSNHHSDAIATAHTWVKLAPEDDNARKFLGLLLVFDRQFAEAVPLLAASFEKSPSDRLVQVQLGLAQLQSGKTAEGDANLSLVLRDSNDPGMLNNAAYALTDAKVDLALAEESGRRAIELLSNQSASWSAASTDPQQLAKTQLLLAAWDTLGWALFQQGKTDEASSYINAAWRQRQQPEVGLHLGQIQEKQGHLEEAASTYALAMASSKGDSTPAAKHISEQLDQHAAALTTRGVKPHSSNDWTSLQKLRTVPLPSLHSPNRLIEYTLLLGSGSVLDANTTSPSDKIPAGADETLRQTSFAAWFPKESEAHLIRKATLNCHSNTCELVLIPF